MTRKLSLQERAKLLISLLKGGQISAENGAIAYQKDSGVSYDFPRGGNSVAIEQVIRNRKTKPANKNAPGRIKILYTVRKMPDLPNSKKKTPRMEDERWFCVGGWSDGQDVVVRKLPWATPVWHSSIDNLPGDDFVVNLSHSGNDNGSERIYEYIRPSANKSWKYTAPKDARLDKAKVPAGSPGAGAEFEIPALDCTFSAPTLNGYFGELSLRSFFELTKAGDTIDAVGSQHRAMTVGAPPDLTLSWMLSSFGGSKVVAVKDAIVSAKTPKKGDPEGTYAVLRYRPSPSWADTYFRCRGHGVWYIGMNAASEEKKDLYETPDFKPPPLPPPIPPPPSSMIAYYIFAHVSTLDTGVIDGGPLPAGITFNMTPTNSVSGSSFGIGGLPSFPGYGGRSGSATGSAIVYVLSNGGRIGESLTSILASGGSLLYFTGASFNVFGAGSPTSSFPDGFIGVGCYRYESRYIPPPDSSVFAGNQLFVWDAAVYGGTTLPVGFQTDVVYNTAPAVWTVGKNVTNWWQFLQPDNARCNTVGQAYVPGTTPPDSPLPRFPPPVPVIVGSDTKRKVKALEIWSDELGSSQAIPGSADVEEDTHLYNGSDAARSSPGPNPTKVRISGGKPMFMRLGGPQDVTYKKDLSDVDKGVGEITTLTRVDRRRSVGVCFYTDLSKVATVIAGAAPSATKRGQGTPRMGWMSTRGADEQAPGETSAWDLDHRIDGTMQGGRGIAYDYGMFMSYRYCPLSEQEGFARIDLGHPRLTLDAEQVLRAYEASESLGLSQRVRESPLGPINNPAYLYTKKLVGIRAKNKIVTVEIYKSRFRNIQPVKKKVPVYKLTETPFVYGNIEVDTGDPRTWDFYCHDISYL